MDTRIIEISDNLRRGTTMPHLQRAIEAVTASRAMRSHGGERCINCGKHAVCHLYAIYPACPSCSTAFRHMTPLERQAQRGRWRSGR